MTIDQPQRCEWTMRDPLMIAYHDDEWGVPCHNDRALFERLILEAFQAGLSWLLILRKRENFRRAFHEWDVERIAAYDDKDVERLLNDPGIIRNRRKIDSTIHNARRFLDVQAEHGSFDRYIWSFVGGAPLLRPSAPIWSAVPAWTPESDRMARELRRRGFKMVGPTMCYSFMQSVGMVNDHVEHCFKAQPGSRSE
ncbi:MAG TPA: DNA-3-methyladenine glycosylase I [Herpetosiphonaceae bacterium]